MKIKKTIVLTCFLMLVLVSISLGLSPTKEYKNTPRKFGMTYEAIDIKSDLDVTLKAWHFPVVNAEHLIIISHNGVGNMGNYLERIKRLQKYGFSVLAYDYRGFGGSSDFNIEPTNYIYDEFYEDLETVIDYCDANFSERLISYGWGIGASIAICRGYNNPKILGIIADDSFSDIYKLEMTFKSKKLTMTLPSNVIKDKNSPFHLISKSAGSTLGGMLLLHSTKDYIITEADQLSLLESSSLSNKELYVFKSSYPMDTFKGNESEYVRRLYLFALNL